MNKTAEEIKAILNNYVIKSPSIGRDVIIADRIDEIVDDLAAAPPPASEGEMEGIAESYASKEYKKGSIEMWRAEENLMWVNRKFDFIEGFKAALATLPTMEPEGKKFIVDANDPKYLIGVLKNIEREMPKAKRKRTLNISMVRDYLTGHTSKGGRVSAYETCLYLGIDPDGTSIKH